MRDRAAAFFATLARRHANAAQNSSISDARCTAIAHRQPAASHSSTSAPTNMRAAVASTCGVMSWVMSLATRGWICLVRTLTWSPVACFAPAWPVVAVPVVPASGAGAGGGPTRVGGAGGTAGPVTVCDWSTP
ncbi:hypothetical protein D7193_15455 [Micromonospora costi]|uniref:Uncharacterized protein n=1 Tax=Micromonospora costi TaxID=1530042 RepID=A0A3B0A6H3_9ACTN|nr:hypothetical protein D7193_15455 [Micromonospora costi]